MSATMDRWSARERGGRGASTAGVVAGVVAAGVAAACVAVLVVSGESETDAYARPRELAREVSDLARGIGDRVRHESNVLVRAEAFRSTRPLVVAPVEAPPPEAAAAVPKLGGIAWNRSVPFAFLNGRVAGVGDTVDGYKVVDIGEEAVVLRDGQGKRHELKLYKE